MTAGACWALLWCSSPAALFSPVPVPSVHEGCILFAVAALPSALHWQPAPAAALLGQALGHQPISVGCSSGVSSSSSSTSFSSSTPQSLLSPQHKTAAAGCSVSGSTAAVQTLWHRAADAALTWHSNTGFAAQHHTGQHLRQLTGHLAFG